MLCVIVVMLCLVAACVVAWPRGRRAAQDVASAPAEPSAASAPGPQTLEGVLTLQLVAGEITGTQYRHAMSTLAARDAERHPLEVPPDAAPPEAA